MYEAFLKQQELPEDVRSVFTALKRASENHLQAFQRNADKPRAAATAGVMMPPTVHMAIETSQATR
jgi:hypothetical protein